MPSYSDLAQAAAQLRDELRKADLNQSQARSLEKMLADAKRAVMPHARARAEAEISFASLSKLTERAEDLVSSIEKFQAQQEADEIEAQHRAAVRKARGRGTASAAYGLDPDDAELFKNGWKQ